MCMYVYNPATCVIAIRPNSGQSRPTVFKYLLILPIYNIRDKHCVVFNVEPCHLNESYNYVFIFSLIEITCLFSLNLRKLRKKCNYLKLSFC